MSTFAQMFRYLYTVPILSLGAASFAYGAYERWLLNSIYGASVQSGFWDIAINVTASPQFLSSIILPAWLIYALLSSQRLKEPTRLLRLGSYRRVLAASYKNAAIVTASSLAVILAGWTLATIGIPLRSNPAPDSPSLIFANAHIVPTAAFALQLATLLPVLFSILSIVIVVRLLTPTPALTVIFALSVWLWVLASTFGLIRLTSPAHPSHFFDAATLVTNSRLGIGTFVIVLCVLGGAWFTVWALDRARRQGYPALAENKILYAVMISVTLLLAVAGANPSTTTLLEVAQSVFAGPAGTITQGLVWNFFFLAPAFLLQIRSSEVNVGFLELEVIRRGTIRHWFISEFTRQGRFNIGYVASLNVGTVLLFFALGGRSIGFPLSVIAQNEVQLLVNGFLQLTVYSAIGLLLLLFIESRSVRLLVLGSLIPLSYIATNTGWNPFGASALTLPNVNWFSVLTSFVTLSGSLIIVLVANSVLARNRKSIL